MENAQDTIKLFAQQKCGHSEYEYVSPEELYSNYVKFTQQPVDRVNFTGEMIRLGWILYRPTKEDGESGWRLRLIASHSDLPEPNSPIQDQLEALRKVTFKSIVDARRAGRHNLANANTRAFLDILKARREEFPPDPGNKEGADYADPE